MTTVRLAVDGMTCRSCEVRVTRRLTAVPGVTRARVDARAGRAEITTSGPVPRQALIAAVERAGYTVRSTPGTRPRRPWLTRDRTVWRDVALAVAGLGAVALLLRGVDLPSPTGPGEGSGAAGGLVVALLLGLAAGFSTCMALVGGLVLAVSAAHQRRSLGGPDDARRLGRLRPHLAFNAGRVVGFTVLGAVLGAAGSALTLDGPLLAVAMIVVAVVMAALGLRLTQVSPRLGDGPGLTLPARLALMLRVDADPDARYRDGRAAGLGAATFLLPCGFTQAVQVYAVSTGSPWQAGALLGLFALGTTPGLLALGGATAAVRGRGSRTAFRVAGVVVLGFAALNVSAAAGILAPGLSLNPFRDAPAAAPSTVSSNVTVTAAEQVLATEQNLHGYAPAESTVYAGTPVRWRITSTSMGCASYLDAGSLGLDRVMLAYGMNELRFTPTKPGTYRFACAMNMYHGVVHVIPRQG